MLPPGPIVSLGYRVPPERRAALLAFLRGAIPFYERPGGIRVGLFESLDEPGLYVELVAYATRAAYDDDQVRVEHDPEMRAVLGEFRAVLGGPAEVRRMAPVDLGLPPTPPRFEDAAFNDHPSIAALLKESGLPVPTDADAPVRMLVARENGSIVACGGWERHGPHALLRSLAVAPAARKRRLGGDLTEAIVARAATEGARAVYLLTADAEAFFAAHGFVRVERSDLPAQIAASRQVTGECCASGAAMRRALGD